MRATITIVALVLAAAGAVAQEAISSGPFSRFEAQRLSEVWHEIRDAEEYRDIDWEAVGLDREPGDAEARRIMATNWGSIRQANEFNDIDWEATAGYDRSSRSRLDDEDRFGRRDDSDSMGPFTQREAALMSAVWPDIRETRSFGRIDWRDVGLAYAPGDAEARTLMAENWETLRRADEFEDIDWQATAGYRTSDRFRDDDNASFRRDRTSFSGPFTRREAELLSEVWPEIREAESFEQIDWEAFGVDYAPGDADARRLMAENWDALREAESFGDIDWEATTGDRRR